MPHRPTKEFWNKHKAEITKEYPGDKEKQGAVLGNIWYHKMSPSKKEKYNKIRIKREKGVHSPTIWGEASIGLKRLISGGI